jgi:DNA repair protein SbcD/Mre11
MQFVHLADTHLGFRQYGLIARENDFYNGFNDIIEKIISERPDFVLHSGDLFESSKPPIRALLTVQNGFTQLKNAGIPIYAIAGNHDIVMRKNVIPPHKLYQDFGLKLIDLKKTNFIHEDLLITGVPYLSKSYTQIIKERLSELSNLAETHKKSILLLHQSVDRYLPFDPEIGIGDIPDNFNYYAFGHIHERIIDDFGKGKLAYPGSTEIWRIDEVAGYKKNGKGFYLVDLNGDSPSVQNIDLKLPREVIKKRIQYFKLEKELLDLQECLNQLTKKPVLHLTVEGGNFDRSEVYETVTNALAELCLSLRPNYKPDDVLGSEIDIGSSEGLNFREIIKKRLNVFNNEEISVLALNILETTSSGNMENAQALLDKFYEGHYDN